MAASKSCWIIILGPKRPYPGGKRCPLAARFTEGTFVSGRGTRGNNTRCDEWLELIGEVLFVNVISS